MMITDEHKTSTFSKSCINMTGVRCLWPIPPCNGMMTFVLMHAVILPLHKQHIVVAVIQEVHYK